MKGCELLSPLGFPKYLMPLGLQVLSESASVIRRLPGDQRPIYAMVITLCKRFGHRATP